MKSGASRKGAEFGLAIAQSFALSGLLHQTLTELSPDASLELAAATVQVASLPPVVREMSLTMLLTSVAGFVLLALILSYGLMTHRYWAWRGTLAVQGLGGLVSVLGLMDGSAVLLNLGRLAIAAFVTSYLIQPDVRRNFSA